MRSSMVLAGPKPTRVPVCGTTTTTLLDTPLTIGATYIDLSTLPLQSVRFQVILSSTSAAVGREAVIDLYDKDGVLGAPAVVAGSTIDTTTGSPPPGGPATNPLLPSAYEIDVAAAFAGFSGKGVFECRLRICVADAVTVASCYSADLLFETS